MINQISPIKDIHEAHKNSIESLAIHPKEEHFATGSHDQTIKLWDLDKFKETMTLADHKLFSIYLELEFGRLTIPKTEVFWPLPVLTSQF